MQPSPADLVQPAEPPIPAEDVHLPERGFTVSRSKALAAALVCWAGWGAMIWAVLGAHTAAIDEAGLMWFRSGPDFGARGAGYVTEAVRDMTALGGVFLSTLATVAAVVALLFLKLRREAVLFAATVILGWLLNNTMKMMIGRDRPSLVPHLTEAGGMSFPSGHSFASAMIYIGMALAFASMSRRHSVRYTLIGTAMVLSALIAWSRVLLGVHYPSDAIAGWLGGAAWAFTAAALLYRPARAAADSVAAERLDPTKCHTLNR
jgi:undecaprenyl-diphosphatase